MKLLLGLSVFLSTVACHGPRPSDTYMRDDGKQCRRYPDGSEYCGGLAGGLPSGQGTIRMSNGQKLTGRWEGRVVHDAELEIDDRGTMYADFEIDPSDPVRGYMPIGSYQTYDSKTSALTQVLVEGESHREVVFDATGSPRRIAEWPIDVFPGGSDVKQVMLLDPDGSQTFAVELRGQFNGDVVRVASDGALTHTAYDRGADVTQQRVHDHLLRQAQAMVASDAEKTGRELETAYAARTAALSDLTNTETDAADRRADDSVKGPCKCIAEKRQSGQDPLGCHQDPTYTPAADSECGCVFHTRACITLKDHDAECDADCERAIKERERETRTRCFAERDAFWAAQREKFRRRTEVCTKFAADPTAVDREWDRLTAKHNAEVDRQIAPIREIRRNAVLEAQKAVDAAMERDRAARERVKAGKEGREEALRREIEIANQRLIDEVRRLAEEATQRHRAKCEARPRLCGCASVRQPTRPKPGSHAVCPE